MRLKIAIFQDIQGVANWLGEEACPRGRLEAREPGRGGRGAARTSGWGQSKGGQGPGDGSYAHVYCDHEGAQKVPRATKKPRVWWPLKNEASFPCGSDGKESTYNVEKWGHLPVPQPPGLWPGWPNMMVLWVDLVHLHLQTMQVQTWPQGFQGSSVTDWGCRVTDSQQTSAPLPRPRTVCCPSVYPAVYGLRSWWVNNHLDTVTPAESMEHTHCPP